MRLSLAVAGAILLLAGTPGFAHRLDEYLQATMLWVEKDRVGGQIHLTPGVAVFPVVLASIDADADGRISDAEQQVYAERMLCDLSLTVDGDGLPLRLVSAKFATTEEMKEGRGEIQLEFRADPRPGSRNRRLVFKNHHLSGIAAYLVNVLVSRDLDIRLTEQNRNEDQSVYQLDYTQAGVASNPLSLGSRAGDPLWISAAGLLFLVRLAWLWRTRRWRLRQPGLRRGSTGWPGF